MVNINERIPQTIHCDIYGDSLISGLIPFGFNDFSLQATFTTDPASAEVTVNHLVQKSGISNNDFSDTVTYTVSFAYRKKSYKVKLVHTHVIYRTFFCNYIINHTYLLHLRSQTFY